MVNQRADGTFGGRGTHRLLRDKGDAFMRSPNAPEPLAPQITTSAGLFLAPELAQSARGTGITAAPSHIWVHGGCTRPVFAVIFGNYLVVTNGWGTRIRT